MLSPARLAPTRSKRGSSGGRELISLLSAPSTPDVRADTTSAAGASAAGAGAGAGAKDLVQLLRPRVDIRSTQQKQSFGRVKTTFEAVNIAFDVVPRPDTDADTLARSRKLALAAAFVWDDSYKKFLWPNSLVVGATLTTIAEAHGADALLRIASLAAMGAARIVDDVRGAQTMRSDWRLPAAISGTAAEPPSSLGAAVEDRDDRLQLTRALFYLSWGLIKGNMQKIAASRAGDSCYVLSAGMKKLELRSMESVLRSIATLGASAEAEVNKYFPRAFFAALHELHDPSAFCKLMTHVLDEVSALLQELFAPPRMASLCDVLLGQFATMAS